MLNRRKFLRGSIFTSGLFAVSGTTVFSYLFGKHSSQLSNLSETELDKLNNIITKKFVFKPKGIPGSLLAKFIKQDEYLDYLFNNEVKTLKKLEKSGLDIAPKLFAFDKSTRTIRMSYVGPDLFALSKEGWKPSQDHLNQVFEIYSSLYRLNLTRPAFGTSNLCLGADNKIRAIDFKWSEKRPSKKITDFELAAIKDLGILDQNLPERLLSVFI